MQSHTSKKSSVSGGTKMKKSFGVRLKEDIVRNRVLYIMVLPVLIYYILFAYLPMYGITIAFQDYDPALGYTGSPWVGLQNFKDFFKSVYFLRILKNTLHISLASIIFGFPAPIILALLINEVTSKKYMKTVQTITYLPHFISLVVVCGIIKSFTGTNGIITQIVSKFTNDSTSLLMKPNAFVPVYIISEIWQGIGWGSIIYIAALAGVDTQLYEAASLDGCGRLRQVLHVSIPGILPTIVIMLILRMGSMLNVGYEKIILLYNPSTYETADVISTFTYRKGLQEFEWSYGSAVGLFNSAVNVIFLLGTNMLSRKLTESSLW